MKQKPFALHETIFPLKMWGERYTKIIRATAVEELPEGVSESLLKLANDIEVRTKDAWADIEHATRLNLMRTHSGYLN